MLILQTIALMSVGANLALWPELNPGCSFDTTHLNSLFMWVVLVPETALRTVALGFWDSRNYLTERNFVLNIATPCFYAVWSCLVACNYTTFQVECYQPIPSYSLVLFSVELILILPQAFFVFCVVTFLIVFSPCIAYSVIKTY